MTPPAPPKIFCITGANSGVGLECARQLAARDGTEKLILACRNPEKANIAKESLEQSLTGNNQTCLEVLILDVSNLASIRKAVDNISVVVDCLILNAGGFVGKGPTERTGNGTTKMIDLNVLGNVYLTDLLIQQKKIHPNGQVLYVSSETARGISLNTCHVFSENGSLEEMKALCDGSYYQNSKSPQQDMDVYGRAKLLGTLWTGSIARQHPDIRFVAVSPGNTAGTNVVNHMRLPGFIQVLANKIALPLMTTPCCGRFHSLEVGARRYLDVILDDGTTYESGHFYASKRSWPTGPVADQTIHLDYLYKEVYQDNASAAIHSFLP